MIIIPGTRCSGKTTKIVEMCKKNEGILLTFSENEACRLKKSYPDLRDRIFSYYSLGKKVAWKAETLFIDNVDNVLNQLFPEYNIAAISLTGVVQKDTKGWDL